MGRRGHVAARRREAPSEILHLAALRRNVLAIFTLYGTSMALSELETARAKKTLGVVEAVQEEY